MIPGNARVLTCPHCGSEKEVMSLISGNTFGATYWSDNKRNAPMLPRPSLIQKCPNCGKYYLINKQGIKFNNRNSSFELGTLNYEESAEALEQLMREGVSEADELNIRVFLVHAYNDEFHRGKEGETCPTKQDALIFTKNVRSLIELLTDKESITFKAELHREIGEFEACVNLLKNAQGVGAYESKIRDSILERCMRSDTTVFKLQ